MLNAFTWYDNYDSIADIKGIGILVALQSKYLKIRPLNEKNIHHIKELTHQMHLTNNQKFCKYFPSDQSFSQFRKYLSHWKECVKSI